MRQSTRIAACLVAALMTSGCFGQFALVRKLYNWNASIGDKWANEVVFLVTAYLLPVYSIAGLADSIIINSIEFWTGENPINSASAPQSKRFALGTDGEAVMSRAGDLVTFEAFKNGESTGTLTIKREDDLTVAMDETGKTVLRSQTLPDGSIIVSNAKGEQVAFYTAEQVHQQIASAAASRQ